MYNDCGIAFAVIFFSNIFPGNLESFGFGNSSSRDFWYRKNNFSVLGERPNDDINESAGKAEKKSSVLTFWIQKQTFLHYNGNNSSRYPIEYRFLNLKH